MYSNWFRKLINEIVMISKDPIGVLREEPEVISLSYMQVPRDLTGMLVKRKAEVKLVCG